ncbi:MAG: VOC family protein [Xanthomonadales bacterium]|nr:VOC family protein [Xanthomonadales bacterium]
MHKSQLAGLIIDCQDADLDKAAAFWSAALGFEAVSDPRSDESKYRRLETPPGDLEIEVQKVDHPSRVHVDIETDDIEAEVARLTQLGAKTISKVHSWVVMEAPTGQRFCIIKPCRANFEQSANSWS